MTTIAKFRGEFARAKRGATAIEYGLLLGLIAIAMLGAVTLLGERVVTLFGGITSEVSAAELIAGGVEGNCGDGAGEGSAECENK